MRISVSHATRYTYGKPVTSAMQLMRLTPRSCAMQFVRRWRVEIDADARLEKSEDAFGNITHLVFMDGPLEAVNISISGEVETTDTGGMMHGVCERQPHGLFLRPTPLTEPSPEIRDFARTIAGAKGSDLLAAVHQINGQLHETMSFTIGATTATTTAADAFAAKAGVCQDFSHVFAAAARAINIPCRYVSGYYLRTDTEDQDAGHAWVECHVPELGWIGFDPAQGLCVNDRYIRVAVGADSREAAPVRGAQSGGRDEALAVSIRVNQVQSMSQA
jgi:transglutaminase-like putative cysteine protease